MQVFEVKIEEKKAKVITSSVEMAARIAASLWDTHPREIVVTYLEDTDKDTEWVYQ